MRKTLHDKSTHFLVIGAMVDDVMAWTNHITDEDWCFIHDVLVGTIKDCRCSSIIIRNDLNG